MEGYVDPVLQEREEVLYHSGSAEQHEEWKDVVESIFQLTGDEDVIEVLNTKADQTLCDKDMAAAGEKLCSKNLNQFKRGQTNQQVAAQDEEGKIPAKLAPMD